VILRSTEPVLRAGRGFTLLEVLVAFAIAALALSALFQGAIGGLRASQSSGRYEQAVSRARSHLAVIGHGVQLAAGDFQGDDGDGYRWRTRIVRVSSAPVARGDAAVGARGPRAALYDVTVVIAWNDGGTERQMGLETRRVGSGPPLSP
jgi:general secretion pathway protein I